MAKSESDKKEQLQKYVTDVDEVLIVPSNQQLVVYREYNVTAGSIVNVNPSGELIVAPLP